MNQRTFVCTSDALRNGFCDSSSLGHFIFDLPPGKSLKDTTFWDARVGFYSENSTSGKKHVYGQASSFWDNADGNPSSPATQYDTPFLVVRDIALSSRSRPSLKSRVSVPPRDLSRRQNSTNSTAPGAIHPSDTLWYEDPLKYEVHNTGYYCIGMYFKYPSTVTNLRYCFNLPAIVPLTVESSSKRQGSGSPHPGYHGTILFQNTFDGKLPATDYPKVNVSLLSSAQ